MDHIIAKNIQIVQERIKAACERSGRSPEDVTLIAVSKLKPFEDIMTARECGIRYFGENYVQELMQKEEQAIKSGVSRQIQWHMIGHLQKNKVKYLIGTTALIHSVDSVPLAVQIEKEAAKREQTVRILLEVNMAGEESKWGFDPEHIFEAAKEISTFPHIRILGLMTSAPYTEEPETNREYFRAMREYAQQLAAEKLITTSDPEFCGPVLSMGMTGDYEVAIEEGATMVRIGTGIFGERKRGGMN